MVKKFSACLLLAVLWCSCACGEVTLYHAHRSLASLTDGHSDYSDARFLNFYVAASDWESSATQADVNLTGTMTFSGGNYSFWDARNGGMLTNSGTQRTFGLAGVSWMHIGGSLEYAPMTERGDDINFCLGADGGLNGVNVSWNLSSHSGQGTIPNYKTTQQQLASCVPYIEFIRSGTQVTGIRWRAVNPSDTSKPAPQNYDMSFCVQRIRDKSGNTIYDGNDSWPYIEANTTPEGIITFDSPIEESEIDRADVYLNNNSDSSNWATYLWYFCKPSTPEPYLYQSQYFTASLVNGKSDYSNARFDGLFFLIEADNVMAEARHFTAEGSVTIPGGGYSLRDDTTDEELGVTIPAGTDKTFKLMMHRSIAPGNTYVEYQPVDENDTILNFSGGAENLAGRTLTWTLPAELNLSGSAALSSFKSTAEQLATGAPYFEIVSRDGNITAINYKIVTASDTSTAITPSYRTDFQIRFDRITPDATGKYYYSSWMNNRASGTWTLEKPQPLSNMENITVDYRTWEDPNKSISYHWEFDPAEAPSTPAITTTSLPAATLNTSYTATLTSNISGATWSVISGSLPAGLTLNASTGDITGTPTAAGTSTFTVRAESGSVSAEKSLSITVNRNSGGSTGIRIENSSSGGCESGLAISSALLLLAFFVKKR